MNWPLLMSGSTAGFCQMTEKMEGDGWQQDRCEELILVKGVGQGHMSRVFLAVHRKTKELYAVKVMSKPNLHQKVGAFKVASRERDILSTLDHPFLPTLFTHFESDHYTFLATKYCSGGDMKVLRLRQPNEIFSEAAARFYAAEVVLALEHLHKKGIVHRDLKPENILVQDNGHIMLTDFDLSLRLFADSKNIKQAGKLSRPKHIIHNRSVSHSFVGTREYIAPEIIWSIGHSFPVDWWSLGVFLYEMVYGRTPFSGASRKETFFNILSKDPSFTGSFSAVQDLIEKLLVKEPGGRLGSAGGANEVKEHRFFHGLRWEELELVSRPPFVPPILPFSAGELSPNTLEQCDGDSSDYDGGRSCSPQHSTFDYF